jgi:hypothetical protein
MFYFLKLNFSQGIVNMQHGKSINNSLNSNFEVKKNEINANEIKKFEINRNEGNEIDFNSNELKNLLNKSSFKKENEKDLSIINKEDIQSLCGVKDFSNDKPPLEFMKNLNASKNEVPFSPEIHLEIEKNLSEMDKNTLSIQKKESLNFLKEIEIYKLPESKEYDPEIKLTNVNLIKEQYSKNLFKLAKQVPGTDIKVSKENKNIKIQWGGLTFISQGNEKEINDFAELLISEMTKSQTMKKVISTIVGDIKNPVTLSTTSKYDVDITMDSWEKAGENKFRLEIFTGKSFPIDPPIDQPEIATRGQNLIHFISEAYFSMKDKNENQGGEFDTAHIHGIAIENAYRMEMGQKTFIVKSGKGKSDNNTLFTYSDNRTEDWTPSSGEVIISNYGKKAQITINPANRDKVEKSKSALSNTNTQNVTEALNTIGQLCDDAISLCPEIILCLKDKDSEIRKSAAEALQTVFSNEKKEFLTEDNEAKLKATLEYVLDNEESVDVRNEAVKALLVIFPDKNSFELGKKSIKETENPTDQVMILQEMFKSMPQDTKDWILNVLKSNNEKKFMLDMFDNLNFDYAVSDFIRKEDMIILTKSENKEITSWANNELDNYPNETEDIE